MSHDHLRTRCLRAASASRPLDHREPGPMRTALAAAALTGVAVLAPLAPAHAEDPKADHSPCVSNRESHSGTVFGMDLEDVEKRWEVTGKGIYTINVLGWGVMAYPWCGHQFHNHSPLPYEFIGLVVSGRDRVRVVTWNKAPVSYDGGQVADPAPVDPTPTVDATPVVVPCNNTKCPLH